MSEYFITGHIAHIARLFELCRDFQNSTPLYSCLIEGSWPINGDPQKGYGITIGKVEFAEQMVKVLAKVCGVTLSEKVLPKELVTKLRTGAYHYTSRSGDEEVVIKKKLFDEVVCQLEMRK